MHRDRFSQTEKDELPSSPVSVASSLCSSDFHLIAIESTNSVLLCRALYSLIQFTTVTLLYAIAGTLGDFQVSPPARPLGRELIGSISRSFCTSICF